jgi:flagellar export protein FliJ
MKKHRFRLDSYLKIKEFEEKLSWSEVLTQMGRVSAIVQKINHLKEQQKNIRKKTSLIGQDQGPQIYELSLAGESIEGTKVKIESLMLELRNEERILERLRLKHVESKKELKTIEKVKENDFKAFKIEKDKKDLKTTSEIALQMHNRGKVENE